MTSGDRTTSENSSSESSSALWRGRGKERENEDADDDPKRCSMCVGLAPDVALEQLQRGRRGGSLSRGGQAPTQGFGARRIVLRTAVGQSGANQPGPIVRTTVVGAEGPCAFAGLPEIVVCSALVVWIMAEIRGETARGTAPVNTCGQSLFKYRRTSFCESK
jgi:hypothetical protein